MWVTYPKILVRQVKVAPVTMQIKHLHCYYVTFSLHFICMQTEQSCPTTTVLCTRKVARTQSLQVQEQSVLSSFKLSVKGLASAETAFPKTGANTVQVFMNPRVVKPTYGDEPQGIKNTQMHGDILSAYKGNQ